MRALAAFALVVAGCGIRSPEEQLLADFFEAASLHDTTMVASVADVDFNPRTDGTVQRFSVSRKEDAVGDRGTARRSLVVDADVHRPDGRQESLRLLITLEQTAQGRWRITSLRPAT